MRKLTLLGIFVAVALGTSSICANANPYPSTTLVIVSVDSNISYTGAIAHVYDANGRVIGSTTIVKGQRGGVQVTSQSPLIYVGITGTNIDKTAQGIDPLYTSSCFTAGSNPIMLNFSAQYNNNFTSRTAPTCTNPNTSSH